MENLIHILQLIVGISVCYVWIFRFHNVLIEFEKFELSDVLKEKYILRNLLHKICVQLQIGTIKQKNIDILLCHINIHAKHKICILKNYTTHYHNDILYFMYHK